MWIVWPTILGRAAAAQSMTKRFDLKMSFHRQAIEVDLAGCLWLVA